MIVKPLLQLDSQQIEKICNYTLFIQNSLENKKVLSEKAK